MGYILKSVALDAIKEDMESTLACYEGAAEKEIIRFCYSSMERMIGSLPQYYPQNVDEVDRP